MHFEVVSLLGLLNSSTQNDSTPNTSSSCMWRKISYAESILREIRLINHMLIEHMIDSYL